MYPFRTFKVIQINKKRVLHSNKTFLVLIFLGFVVGFLIGYSAFGIFFNKQALFGKAGFVSDFVDSFAGNQFQQPALDPRIQQQGKGLIKSIISTRINQRGSSPSLPGPSNQNIPSTMDLGNQMDVKKVGFVDSSLTDSNKFDAQSQPALDTGSNNNIKKVRLVGGSLVDQTNQNQDINIKIFCMDELYYNDGKNLLVGTGEGLYRYNKEEEEWEPLSTGEFPQSTAVYDILSLGPRNAIYSTDNGLFYYDGITLRQIMYSPLKDAEKVTIDGKNYIFFGGVEGLYYVQESLLAENPLTKVYGSPGIPVPSVKSLSIVDISGEKYIYYLTYTSLERIKLYGKFQANEADAEIVIPDLYNIDNIVGDESKLILSGSNTLAIFDYNKNAFVPVHPYGSSGQRISLLNQPINNVFKTGNGEVYISFGNNAGFEKVGKFDLIGS